MVVQADLETIHVATAVFPNPSIFIAIKKLVAKSNHNYLKSTRTISTAVYALFVIPTTNIYILSNGALYINSANSGSFL